MKANSIFNRYMFREMLPPFGICVLFFTFIFLLTQMLNITNMVVNYNVSLFAVFRFIVYMMPFFLIYIFPMATMLTTLLTLLKMSGDNEIVALKASGVSIYRLLPPVFLMGLIGCLLTGFMSIYALPWGRMSSKKLIYEVASKNLKVDLKERTFNHLSNHLMVYANGVDIKNDTLIDMLVKVTEGRDKGFTIVAPKGEIKSDPDKMLITLKAFKGMITNTDLSEKEAHSSSFNSCEIRVDLKKSFREDDDGEKDEEEMTLSELSSYLKTADREKKQYHIALTEYHRKFAVPFACFALGLISFPIGVQFKSRKRSFGFGLSFIIFLCYYIMLSIGWVLGEAGVYPPLIGMWLPNIVIGAFGIYFLKRAANENPVDFSAMFYPIRDLFSQLIKRIKRSE